MKTLDTALTPASLIIPYDAFASAAVAASKNDPIFGGSVLGPDPRFPFGQPWTGAETAGNAEVWQRAS